MLRLRSITITTLQTPHVKGGGYLQICNFYFIKVFVDLVFIGFYVTLSAPDVKEAGNALEKDGTHLHLQSGRLAEIVLDKLCPEGWRR